MKKRVIDNHLNVIDEEFITKMRKNYRDSDKSYIKQMKSRPKSRIIIKYEGVNSGQTKSSNDKEKKKIANIMILPAIINANATDISESSNDSKKQ